MHVSYDDSLQTMLDGQAEQTVFCNHQSVTLDCTFKLKAWHAARFKPRNITRRMSANSELHDWDLLPAASEGTKRY